MTDAVRFLPPEWAPQSALWCGWPRLADEWGGDFHGARAEIAAFARVAAGFLPVKLAAGSDEAARSAREAVGDVAEIIEVPTGDIWLRDTGPIITTGQGGAQAETFRFNGWGGKYLMQGDTDTAMSTISHVSSRRGMCCASIRPAARTRMPRYSSPSKTGCARRG